MKNFFLGLLILIAVGSVGCRQPDGEIVEEETTAVSQPITISTTEPTPLPPPQATSPASTIPPTWPSPLPAAVPFGQTVPVAAANVAEQLNASTPPVRDDVRLAIAYRGLAAPPAQNAPLVSAPFPVGTRQPFQVGNIEDNTVSEIEAELLYVSDHAYFWFDLGRGSLQPPESALRSAGNGFDALYDQVVFYFGSEDNPGIDGDPRVHILHVSPLSLCNVTILTLGNCGLAGYVAGVHFLPTEVDARSNEREMFIMNARQFESGGYLGVLAHEFRHMIEANYDKSDDGWVKEGSATLAAQLVGLPSGGPQRGNQFLLSPDQQLNAWGESGNAPRYGQGFLLNRYIFDRLGESLHREFATSPLSGFAALDEIASRNRLPFTAVSLWEDWLATLLLHNEINVPEPYQMDSRLGLATAVFEDIPRGETVETTVHQFAADYYRLPPGQYELQFSGDSTVPLLQQMPASGNQLWYALRHNYSNPRLTRTVDLRNVTQAQLQYAAYVDIELGYDFAYVSVSTDGGTTWQGLVSNNMQGLENSHDPANAAYTDRFYTGRSQGWLQETADLTPFAGQQILLRFEYITDLALNFGGFGIDNIAIPEIGFYDDVETLDPGWVAEGFVHATGLLPQTWHLQLVRFVNGTPTIERLALDANQQISLNIETELEEKRPFLIVAASAPETLELATYRLQIGN